MASTLVPLKRAIAILLIFLVSGCNYPSTPAAPTTDLVATAVAGTLAAVQPSASPAAENLLPHSLYFLSQVNHSEQVWRLESDGVTQTQVTNETNRVDSYDVSHVDGSVAYVTNNQLYLENADGSDRRLLVDNAATDPEDADYVYRQRISDPKFSPDGRWLAYVIDGLWILDLATNQAVHLAPNQLEETENGIFPDAIYTPLSWAPNSEQLLLSVGGFESSTLAFLNPGADQLITIVQSSTEIACCQAAWAPDSGSVLLASPYIGLIEPGLWRYDARTGEQTELITVTDGMFQFVGWPLELADGSLRYFYTSSTEIPAGDLPLFMMRGDADGVSNRIELRPDSFSNIGEALWAEGGSLAVLVQLSPSGEKNGSVILVFADGRQLQILLPSAHELKWGP